MEKISKLTPEQEAWIPKIRDEWLKVGLQCGPCDRESAEAGVRLAYEIGGLPPPARIVWCDSLYAGVKYVKDIYPSANPGDFVIWGQHDAGWLALTEFYRLMGVTDLARGLVQVARNCGWWWAFDDLAVLTERASELHRDEDGELHNENGAAVLYPDGKGLWAIHGVTVPKYVIENPEEITVEKIKAENNAEVRRIMRGRFGEGNYLSAIGAKVIHVDSVSVDKVANTGCIQRALIEDDEGNRYLVGSDGSTDRVYYMATDRDDPPRDVRRGRYPVVLRSRQQKLHHGGIMQSQEVQAVIQQIFENAQSHAAPDTKLRFIRTVAVGQWIRQGDIYITCVESIPDSATERVASKQLAPGSTKGSRHTLEGDAEIRRDPHSSELQGPYFSVEERVEVAHPEHDHYSFPRGNYSVTYQRDFAREEMRRVED